MFADSLTTLYARLDPTSVAEHFAFYELYPQTYQGRQALKHGWELLSGSEDPSFVLPELDLQPLIELVNRAESKKTPLLPEEQLAAIDLLARPLANRRLKGFQCESVEALQLLPEEGIDLARGLLLAEGTHSLEEIRSYEATLDLMALQVLAHLNPEASDVQKIRALNDYIFHEMRFRFPPHSLYAQDIDLYTFLPSVLDSRRGVCLGVSILYLTLAQRLDLKLEAVTPPGHIFLRYRVGDELVNIETTARGLDLPSEVYLGIETRALDTRTVREVIGLAFMNQAAVAWHRKDPSAAIGLYKRAELYLPNDPLLQFFLALNHLFAGHTAEGRELLHKVRDHQSESSTFPDSIAADYLDGRCDLPALQAVFSEVDASRASILEKQVEIQETLKRCPRFRQGHFHLAITYLQLSREKEGLEALHRYLEFEPHDPTAHYYAAVLSLHRFDYPGAWSHYRAAAKSLAALDHHPQALRDLHLALKRASPEN